MALLPALFTEGDGGEPPVTTVLLSAPRDTTTSTTAVPPSTTTTVPPTTVATAPPTTAAPARQAAPATTTTTAAPKPKPKPTTTTTAPPAPKPAPKPATAGNAEEGRATWYELEGSRPGMCAHKTLPFGTIVTVTNTNTGKSIQCEVGDRGPFVEGYVIDLYRTDFEQLQPTSKGWFPARITW